ncbi:hypothetical protein A3G63_01670 [Candidatus Kaiserbacteria bacterium RIFCSPLOWO2_12_FULL_52_8]|uniref:Uncharacterized protein n=1 Tax=Candidatus Kaiserbacteria bacterium RIFCSPHIGHO2_01_FULL_53_31 TaxID=1798481 RepID=A0A1F6CIP2_9BACT|nr:MAG: hypothetical protein A2678_00520 [Candidatus Kaiserbacteria bacterium RIFCSPHIGHO2_01_FULL_53_31]OGG94350.1 MAG: hypothetical protein A3G63_01670 [Candidatus Kaiserbacteria bacterium RIFCSPLOWO2_12_FULL_52_8]
MAFMSGKTVRVKDDVQTNRPGHGTTIAWAGETGLLIGRQFDDSRVVNFGSRCETIPPEKMEEII